jgi:signal transduction histidine kinase
VLAGLGGGADDAGLATRLAELTMEVEDRRAGGTAAPHAGGGSSAELLDLLMETELAARYRDGAPPTLPELLRIVRSFRPPAFGPDPGAEAPAGFDDPSVVVGLAHDLRSPLTSVLFLSDALRSGYAGDTSDVQRRQLGIIYSAALGLVSMANDILDLYRLGDELVDERPSAFSMSEIAASIGDIVRPIAEERRVDLRFALEGEDVRLGHPVALARVLLNLVVNGLKYTESGFVEVSAAALGDGEVEFSVRDSGAGIRPEQEAMLVQPVRRVSRWNGPGFSGTGLGLTLARNLVRAMGSELAYETAAGVGTRFHFRLELPPAPPP